jgi:hypothetical protein
MRHGAAGGLSTGTVGDNVWTLLHVEQCHRLRVQHLAHVPNNNISQMHPKMKPAGQTKCQPKYLKQKHGAHPTSHKEVVWHILHAKADFSCFDMGNDQLHVEMEV